MSYHFPFRIPLITSTPASSSTSISFTSGISANFSTYLVKIRNLLPATNNVSLLLTFSTNNGSTYLNTNYVWSLTTTLSSNSNTVSSSASDSSITICGALSNTSTQVLNGDIMLFDLAQGTYVPKLYTHMVYYNQTPAMAVVCGGGMNTGTTAINAIQFAMSSGAIASGTISLYGIEDGAFLY